MSLAKSSCLSCDGHLEFEADDLCEENSWIQCPHCGAAIKLAVPELVDLRQRILDLMRRRVAIRLPTPGPSPFIRFPWPARTLAAVAVAKKCSKSRLPLLTVETVRAKTKIGNTPLHRAAKEGRFHEIPHHLLSVELFLVKNDAGETPLHVAAKNGHLDTVPRQFLTRETLTVSISPHYAPDGVYVTGSGYQARTETVFHIAVRCGHADQIPKQFFTPEFLSIPAIDYWRYCWTTLLHDLGCIDRRDLVPAIYAESEMWNLQNWIGQTPRDMFHLRLRHQSGNAKWGTEPATEKQKFKLRWFGCTWDDGITKAQASDAIGEFVRAFPDRDVEYYNRPATEEQRNELRSFRKNPDRPWGKPRTEPLTYGEAKNWLGECFLRDRERFLRWVDDPGPEIRRDKDDGLNRSLNAADDLGPEIRREKIQERELAGDPPTEGQMNWLKEFNLELNPTVNVSAREVSFLMKLHGKPPRAEERRVFKRHSIVWHQGDALAAYAAADLIRYFEKLPEAALLGSTAILRACMAAQGDPALQRTFISRSASGRLIYSWPEYKLQEWWHQANKRL